MRTARSATLDHRRRLFGPQTPLKMGGACPVRPFEVPICEISQPNTQSAGSGYAYDDMLIWDAVTRYSGGRVAFSGWLGPDLGTIQAELDAGRPVVAEVSLGGNQHFVLLTGYTTEGGIVINDPWFADSVRFVDRY